MYTHDFPILSVVLCCVVLRLSEVRLIDRYGASEEVGTRERSELKTCGFRLLDVTVLSETVEKSAIV